MSSDCRALSQECVDKNKENVVAVHGSEQTALSI